MLRASAAAPRAEATIPSFELHAFPDSAAFARRLGRACGVRPHGLRVHAFPDGEHLVRVRAPVARHAVLVGQLHDPDAKLFPLLQAADALRRAGARRITLVAPYLPYMRQDRVFHPGEALSQRVFARHIGEAFDRVLTLEAHLHRVAALREVFPCPARSLSAAPLLADFCARGRGQTLLVGPDGESGPWVRAVARAARLPFVVGEKRRLGDRRVRIALPPVADPGRFARAVVVDDIASSGTTLAAAASALRRAGVRRVEAAVVHAVFAPGAFRHIRRAGIARLVSCDTVPHETNRIVSAGVFARALGVRAAG